MSHRATDAPAHVALNRSLSLPLVTLYGLGVTVGAGIYVLVGQTAAMAGAFAPVAFILAAIVVGFTAFSYAELSTRLPVSAGAAAYVAAGLGKVRIAQAVGLAVAVSGVVSASAVAIGAGGYLADLLGLRADLMAVLVVLVMGALAWWGITQSVATAAVITVIEISGLFGVVLWATWVAEPSGTPLAAMVPPLSGPHWAGIAAASVLAFFAFVGFEDIVNIAEEARDPRHVLPRAIGLTLVVTTLVYIAVVAAVLHAVPLEALAGSEAPLGLVFAAAPQWVQATFSSVAVVATINGVLIQIIMASRVLYGMADRGQLPARLSYVSPRTRTPTVATALVVVAIIALSQLVPIERLAGYTAQIVLTVFIFVNLSLIALKRQSGAEGDHFRVPMLIPVLGVLSSAALLVTALL
ncbi:APC family permease [Cognatishimia sp. F0-27]|uniref:APC family permease n=1 Tax=Cognatishimia sp. F0-27 TaxID=2816855 RepID=UPI001D0BFDB4|nr:APC family permease [Cognatishimia sp. F0-27]MCC1494641.1 amino acid permease [Cognatishimia sp. F0-27]